MESTLKLFRNGAVGFIDWLDGWRETRCSEKAWRIDQALNKYADESLTQPKGILMLWTIIVILVVLWLLGFIGHVGGSLIHILLVIAVIVLIINLVQGRRGL